MGIAQRLKSFTVQSMRVWRILKKPSGQEFKLTTKVSIIGVLVLGLIGFIFAILMSYIV